MAKIVDIEEIISQLEWCDLIIEDEISGELPRCYDYPNGCNTCETKKILDRLNYKKLITKTGKRKFGLRNGKYNKQKGEIIDLTSKRL